MRLKTLFTLTLFTALAGFSSAATIVQSQTFGIANGSGANLLFNKFNTTLGTLTSVTVNVLMGEGYRGVSVDNDSTTGGTIILTHTVTGQLSSSVSLLKAGGLSSVGQLGSLTIVSTSGPLPIGATTGDPIGIFNYQYGNVDYNGMNSGSYASVSDSGNIDTSVISQYASPGLQTFGMTFAAPVNQQATGLSGLHLYFDGSEGNVDATVTYNYLAVPEPASALLGGIGCLALLRRRRH